MPELVCGNCTSTAFESVAGKRVCVHCHAEVDNEVAVAIEHGLTAEEVEDGAS